MNIENWKDIPGYEGCYQASTLGRIRSVDRTIIQKGRGGLPFARTLKGKILSPGRHCKSGHVSVVLHRGTPGLPVHQLVLRTFVGPPPEGMEVRHLDGNPQNNALDNLCYGSRHDNIIDVYRQGKAWRRLTLAEAQEIKDLLNRGYTAPQIARIMKTSESSVYHIKEGRTFYWTDEVI